MNKKTCSKCKIEKDVSEFYKQKRGVMSKCKECFKKYRKEYYKENKEKINKNQKEYYEKNKNYHKEYNKSKKYKEYQKEYQKDNVIHKTRLRLNMFLKNINLKTYEKNKTMRSIGLNKKQFQDWINYNVELDNLKEDYHIDHVRPLSSFNVKTFDEIIECKCNHWTNIRPISSYDNLSKNNRLPTHNELLTLELRVYIFKNNL